jgi:MFS family permease
LVNVPRTILCNNTHAGVIHDPSLTFWAYLAVRTAMGVLTAASLMMFEGAVMATVQEMGGDYGIQRFVGNFGAIVFAPLGGYVIDATMGYEAAIYIYLVLKLVAALLILLINLDFKPPGTQAVLKTRLA